MLQYISVGTLSISSPSFVNMNQSLNTIEEALADISAGKIIIVMDDEQRENEGDFVAAAERVTPEMINFMTRYGRGLVCAPLTEERCKELGLQLMVAHNTALHGTPFTVPVDAKGHGVTTGISAHDRAATIAALLDPSSGPEDFARPGHVFPLMAKQGGVLRRKGHTEAGIDLARMAGLAPAAVLCEILHEDGTMARRPQLIELAAHHNLKIISIEQLIQYRLRHETLIEKVTEVDLPTTHGNFSLIAYKEITTGEVHLALRQGNWKQNEPVLVRVHSSCKTGDVLGSLRCDCGPQLHAAMDMITREGKGVVLYMQQEGRGIGLLSKLQAYKLQEQGLDTVEANLALGYTIDERDYGVGCQILRDLGITRLRLISNNPAKYEGIRAYGLEITKGVPLEISSNPHNVVYLQTKRDKLGHALRALPK